MGRCGESDHDRHLPERRPAPRGDPRRRADREREAAQGDAENIAVDGCRAIEERAARVMSDPFDIDDDKPKLPVVVPLENDEKFLRLWMHLDERKRTFLLTWQECNYSERAAAKKLNDNTQTYRRWANNCEAYRVCRKILRDTAMAEALDKGRLVIENKKIVGLALAKKPILYQGQPTGFFERDLGTALRGNEQLMRAGGHLKEEK